MVSPDPAGMGAVDLTNPQTLNRYAYVANDPLNNIDPAGTCDEPCYKSDVICGAACFPGWSVIPPIYWSYFLAQFGQTNQPSGSGTNNTNGSGSPSGSSTTTNPANNGTQKPGYCQSSGSSSVVAFTATKALTEAGAFVGSAFGPEGTFAGAVIGSQFGAGGNISYVNATHSVYIGVTGVFAPAQIGGGGGFSLSYTPVPATQNANSIANGTSYGVAFQANPLLGSVVSKSPNSGPPVVGFQAGTRSPVSSSASHNICIWHCGC